MQPESPQTKISAFVSLIAWHLSDAICRDMAGDLTANVPPKPQHSWLLAMG
jgi:hypothetical protein